MTTKNFNIFILFIIMSSCNLTDKNNQTFEIDEFEASKEFKSNPKDYLLTVNDFIYDSIYNNRNYKDLESLKIESDSTLPLKMVYRFKVRDTTNNLSMTIGSIINVDNTVEEAEFSLKLYKSGFEGGLDAESRGVEIVNLDSVIRFGDYSEFVGYRQDGDINAYLFISRFDKLVILNSFHSNHTHVDYLNYLKKKIEEINKKLPQTTPKGKSAISSSADTNAVDNYDFGSLEIYEKPH